MRAGRAFGAVVVASLLVAGLLLWPRLVGRDRPAPGILLGSSSSAQASGPDDADTREPLGTGGEAAVAADAGAPGGPLAGWPEPVPAYVRVHPDTDAVCPAGMLLVEGVHCPFVAHRCEQPRMAGPTERCDRYGDRLLCEGRPLALRFCIDRYEYPNLRGVRPAIMIRYAQALEACRIEGKRLCDAEEWVMACEGPGTWPYPTGLLRDAKTCNVDRPAQAVDRRALAQPRQVSVEVERVDRREPSGERPGCVSRWGVYDLVGNAEEWTSHRSGQRRGKAKRGALAGGDWGRGPAACRTLDTTRGSSEQLPEVGFRCCADPLDGEPARRWLRADKRLRRVQRVIGADALPDPVGRSSSSPP